MVFPDSISSVLRSLQRQALWLNAWSGGVQTPDNVTKQIAVKPSWLELALAQIFKHRRKARLILCDWQTNINCFWSVRWLWTLKKKKNPNIFPPQDIWKKLELYIIRIFWWASWLLISLCHKGNLIKQPYSDEKVPIMVFKSFQNCKLLCFTFISIFLVSLIRVSFDNLNDFTRSLHKFGCTG